ncbi:MAG: PH domain-containing protein [Oscillospiraceae bacterium]
MSFEKDAAKAEINKAALMPSVLTALIIDAIIVSFSVLYFGSDFDSYIIETAIVCVLVLLITAGSKMFILNHTTLALTEKRIYGKTGIINTTSMDSPISKINSISVEQGFWGKVFHYSTVSVSTSSGNYKFAYIKNADSFKEETMEQIEAYENEKLRNQAAMLADSLS